MMVTTMTMINAAAAAAAALTTTKYWTSFVSGCKTAFCFESTSRPRPQFLRQSSNSFSCRGHHRHIGHRRHIRFSSPFGESQSLDTSSRFRTHSSSFDATDTVNNRNRRSSFDNLKNCEQPSTTASRNSSLLKSDDQKTHESPPAPGPFEFFQKTSRRDLVLASSVLAAAAAAANFKVVVPSSIATTSSDGVGVETRSDDQTILQDVSSLKDAIQILDKFGDRTYLRTVTSLRYRHLLYRGISSTASFGGSNQSSSSGLAIRNESYDLLDPITYGNDPDAINYFQTLETTMKQTNDVIHPSCGHLATTSPQDAAQWGGSAVSVWPLLLDSSSGGDKKKCHYAWYQDGGLFYPRKDSGSDNGASIIVNGIQCGEVSLEDAIQMPHTEIMFSSKSFLAVPMNMEEEFIHCLEQSYLI